MLRVLLAKDLRRARRNPLPWMINLILPLALTALIGLAFGGGSNNGGLGVIHLAVVDEDDSPLTRFLRGAANQAQSGKYLDPVFMDRTNAMREINANKLSAVFIIPTNFTRHYLLGSEKVDLELIKNPAESIHPAVLEEGLGAVVTAMNAISRNFQSEFPELQATFQGKVDYKKISGWLTASATGSSRRKIILIRRWSVTRRKLPTLKPTRLIPPPGQRKATRPRRIRAAAFFLTC